MAHRTKQHYRTLHELITFKGEFLDRHWINNPSERIKHVLQERYKYELDHYYEKVMYISADCRQWLKAASNFKAAGDTIGYNSCMENYKHYHERKIQLTNKQLF